MKSLRFAGIQLILSKGEAEINRARAESLILAGPSLKENGPCGLMRKSI